MGKLEETYEILRLAVPLMLRHGIPATEDNYCVWYKYVSGVDEELKQTIDAMIASGESFGEEKNKTLFDQYCLKGDKDELKRIRDDLVTVLKSLLDQTKELTGQAEQYDSCLSTTVAKLNDVSTVNEIRDVVDEVMKHTKNLAKYGRAVRHRLEATIDALSVSEEDLLKAKAEATLDFLTGVPNRRAFFERLFTLTRESARNQTDLCLLFVDIDHFKNFNDEFGHLLGDEVLKFVGSKTRETIRETDFVARFGGEEFAIIMPRTPVTAAGLVAERIRTRFALSTLKTANTSKNLGMITVSVGVARYRFGEPPEEFVDRADRALYAAKTSGRNRVSIDEDDLAESEPSDEPAPLRVSGEPA
jgi:diguanylate cyclase